MMDNSFSELLSKRTRRVKLEEPSTKNTARTKNNKARKAPREGRDALDAESSARLLSVKRASDGVHAVKNRTAKAGQLVGKGTRVVGKGVGVAGKGTVRLGAKTGKGALSTTRLIAKNTVKVGKGTVGVVNNLQNYDVAELAAKGVTGLTNLAARTLKGKEVAAAAAWPCRTTSRLITVELKLACRNLRRKDAFAESDAFAVLWQVPSGYGDGSSLGRMGDESHSSQASISLASLVSDGSNGKRKRPRVPRLPTAAEKEIGRTEVIQGCKNPEFQHTFSVNFHFEQEQTYLVRVYDRDEENCKDLKEHDFLGGTIFTLGELMGMGRRTLRRPLRTKGHDKKHKSLLTIQGNEVSSTRSVLEFRFAAESLTEKDNKMRIDRQGDLFFRLHKLSPDQQSWSTIYKSEVVMHNSSPAWAKTRIPLPEICDNDTRNPIKLTFWDYLKEGQYEELGYIETTTQMLVAEAERGIPVLDIWKDRKRRLGGTRARKHGKLKVLRAELKPVPTLLEYVAGGCQLDVTIAVDCSLHNDMGGGTSLHDRPAAMWLNDYAAAINRIGRVTEPFSNGEFNLWGYGAALRGEETSHFAMGYGDGAVQGATGLLDAYDASFIENPHFMEPVAHADIAPLIQSAMYGAIQKFETEHCYSLLCILTTGRIGDDLREIVDTVCTAAEDAPLSIVIIGVGDNTGEFEAIKEHLANGGKLRHSNGVPIARDILGFAALSDFQQSAEKAVAEALREVPEQCVEYFTDNGIQPRPPLAKEEMSSSSTSIKDSSRMKDTSRSMRDGSRMKDTSSMSRKGRDRSSRSPASKERSRRARDPNDHRRR